MNEEIKVRSEKVTCPESHISPMVEPGLGCTCSDSLLFFLVLHHTLLLNHTSHGSVARWAVDSIYLYFMFKKYSETIDGVEIFLHHTLLDFMSTEDP